MRVVHLVHLDIQMLCMESIVHVQVQYKVPLLKITCLVSETGAFVLTLMPKSIENKDFSIMSI